MADLHQQITDQIIAQLEAGTVPWVCPWVRGGGASMPCNLTTGAPYSGINVLLLWLATQDSGFETSEWMTYRQAADRGWQVKKGSSGARVVYANRFTPEKEKARAASEGGDARSVPFLRSYTVFNRAQVDGPPPLELALPHSERQMVAAGEQLIAMSGADFRIGGSEAFYAPSMDYVQVPEQLRFVDQINWYRTACHELTHWTGHATRLKRVQDGGYGTAAYAKEELIAEIGAAFTLATLGIAPTVRHADYIGAWLKVLRDDKTCVIRAAAAATKASRYLLDIIQPQQQAAE